jgi:chromosome segregation ATPase
MIRKHPRQAGNREMYNMMYDQVRQLNSYIRQMNLLRNQNITTMEGLNQYKKKIEQQIGDLARQRSGLYRKLRSGENCQASIDGLSAQLKALRQTLRDCTAIQERSEEALRRIREAERQRDDKECERGSRGQQRQDV